MWLKLLSHKYILYKQVRTPLYKSGKGILGKLTGPFGVIPMFIKEFMVLLYFAIALFYANPKSYASENGKNPSNPLQLSWSMVCNKCKKSCRMVKSNRPTMNEIF